MNDRQHYRTARPLWEDVAGWILAAAVAALAVYFVSIGLTL